MLTKRIIACLDVKNGRVVKGIKFRNHRDMGDILELSKRYRDEGVDELVFYDITASSDGRLVSKSWIEIAVLRLFLIGGANLLFSAQRWGEQRLLFSKSFRDMCIPNRCIHTDVYMQTYT